MSGHPVILPAPPPALDAYDAVVVRRRVGVVSGQFPFADGVLMLPGRAEVELTLAEAREACRIAADNALAQVHAATDGFARLDGLLRLDGYVACANGFDAVPTVLDAASARLVEVLGEGPGRHARSAVAVARLPLGAAVELVLSFSTT